MISLTVKQSRNGFFDRPAVIRAVGRAKAAVLSKFGAYVRRSARSSIRPDGKKGIVSGPGEPPRSHVGTLRKFLNFAWDPRSQSPVVGPEKTNQVFFDGAMRPVTGTVPGVPEHGALHYRQRQTEPVGERGDVEASLQPVRADRHGPVFRLDRLRHPLG
jgi:hypothetical protein